MSFSGGAFYDLKQVVVYPEYGSLPKTNAEFESFRSGSMHDETGFLMREIG